MPKPISFWDHPIETLEKALHIRKQIEALKASLRELYGDGTQPLAKETPAPAVKVAKRRGRPRKNTSAAPVPAKVDGRKGKRSAATIAKMAAAQKARWKKVHGESKPAAAPAVKGPKTKRVVSKASKARMSAGQRARRTKEKIAPQLSIPEELVW